MRQRERDFEVWYIALAHRQRKKEREKESRERENIYLEFLKEEEGRGKRDIAER